MVHSTLIDRFDTPYDTRRRPTCAGYRVAIHYPAAGVTDVRAQPVITE